MSTNLKLADLVRSNPTVISDAINGVNLQLASGTGEDKADAALAAVISVGGALYPQYAAFEGVALAGLKGLIKVVYDLMSKHGLLQTSPAAPATDTPTPAPAPTPAG